MSIPREASIVINGTVLSPGQSMALRVACLSYFSEMENDNALGSDEHGRNMTRAYRERMAEIVKLIAGIE